MAVRTLDAMAAGGIYDHLVGGFCRYSTDARWLVPHFEKMLTDQALLARAYLHAWQDGGRGDYLGVVTETLDFVLRDLSTPEGALYSSFDADAGGVEGGHATFTLDELRELLPPDLVRAGRGVVRHHRSRELGRPLHPGPPGRGAPGAAARDRRGPALLAAARAQRVQPARDEKVLTEWNAMAVATLAEVAAATGQRPTTGIAPRRSASFLWASMYVDGRLMRSWQGGRARHLAVAADHAWLAEACLRLSEWTGRSVWRERAVSAVRRAARPVLGRRVRRLLLHRQRRRDARRPAQGVPRRRAPADQLHRRHGAAPGQRAGRRPALDDAVARTLALARPLLERHPGPLADLVAALPMWSGRNEIVVTGDRPDLLGRGAPPLAARRRRRLGRARRRPAVRRTAARARAGLRLPGAVVPDARRGRRYPRRPARGARRMSDDASGTGQPGLRAPDRRHGGLAGPERTSGLDRIERATRTDTDRGPEHGRTDARRSGRRRRDTPLSPPRRPIRRAWSAVRPGARSGSRPRAGPRCTSSSSPPRSEDTTVVDLATRTVMRVRVPWPEGHEPDIATFDVVEVTLADDPERDDLAQPEATTVADLPRHVGTLRGRHAAQAAAAAGGHPRRAAARLPRAVGPLLGVPGLPPLGGPDRADPRAPADPPPRRRLDLGPLRLGPRRRLAAGGGPQRRPGARCGTPRAPEREEPGHGARVRAAVPAGHGSPPRDGHCYKVCAAVLPRG